MNISYYFEDGENEHSLECEIGYERAFSGSWRDGQQQEPDVPEIIEVLSAKLAGVDIVSLLSQTVLDKIEQKASEEINEGAEP